MKKLLTTLAALWSATAAIAANISKAESEAGTMNADGTAYTASELVYAADMSTYNLGTGEGYVAGIKLTWDNNKQKASSTKAKVVGEAGLNNVVEYTVYNWDDQTPSGSGLTNTFTSTGIWLKTYYMDTTKWYIYVTPEAMYQCFTESKD